MKTYSKKPLRDESRASITCPVCGGEQFTSRWTVDATQWVRCRRCSLLLQNPQPLTENILERYDDEYFQYEKQNEEGFLQLMKLGLKDVGFSTLAETAGNCRSFLDIGCATGRLIASLRDEGWQTEGVEVCQSSAEFGSRTHGIPIFVGTVDQAGYGDGSFCFVHNSHVIEHVNQPDDFMAEIYRILKPGGYYICTTPNSRGMQALLFRQRWRSAIPDHLFLFSTKTLPQLARKAGFQVLKRRTWGGLGKGTSPEWIKKIADPMVKILNWGDVMIYLFRKPLADGNPVPN